jgi:pyruvate formate lyase activating enzyme
MEIKAVVNKIIPFSNVDGPGNRLSIFFQECNVNCVYCHNHETINLCRSCKLCIGKCPKKALSFFENKIVYNEEKCCECDTCIKICPCSSSPRTKEYTVDELLKIIDEYKLFIRGITVSGGEATLKAPFVTELFKRVKKLGLTCFVDTNGFFNKNHIEELIDVTDKFMIDIKAVDKIEELCGTKLKNNLENLEYLLKQNKVYEVRTVLIENYMDMENTVKTVANIIKDYPEVIYKLIRVHITGLREEQKEIIKGNIPSEEYVRELVNMAEKIGVRKIESIC